MIELKLNTQDLTDLLDKLQSLPKGLETATARAINKTLTTTRAEMVRMIRAEYDIKAGDIRNELDIVTANASRLEGRIDGESSPGIPLIKYALGRRVPSTERTDDGGYTPQIGIPVRIRRDKGKIIFKGAFLATMKSGHMGAFIRVNRKQKQKFTDEDRTKALALRRELGSATLAARALGMSVKTLRSWTKVSIRPQILPDNRRIEELYGPSPLKLLSSDAHQEYIEDYCQEALDKNMQHEAEYFLSQAGL